jgi:hypothetical protein
VPVRVEAAAYRGLPVYFEVMPTWREAERRDSLPTHLLDVVGLALLPAVMFLAVGNLRRGRADVRGAMRLGLAILACTAAAWLLGGHHTLAGETAQLAGVLGFGGWLALQFGLGYLQQGGSRISQNRASARLPLKGYGDQTALPKSLA